MRTSQVQALQVNSHRSVTHSKQSKPQKWHSQMNASFKAYPSPARIQVLGPPLRPRHWFQKPHAKRRSPLCGWWSGAWFSFADRTDAACHECKVFAKNSEYVRSTQIYSTVRQPHPNLQIFQHTTCLSSTSWAPRLPRHDRCQNALIAMPPDPAPRLWPQQRRSKTMANMKGVASTVTKKLQKLSKMIATELIPSKKMDLYMYIYTYIPLMWVCSYFCDTPKWTRRLASGTRYGWLTFIVQPGALHVRYVFSNMSVSQREACPKWQDTHHTGPQWSVSEVVHLRNFASSHKHS